MSTPTPRTDAEENQAHRFESSELVVKSSTTRALETQLTAALARIAELEKENDEVETQLSDARNGWESALTKIDDVSRQLSESQAQLASAREDGAKIAKLAKEYANRVLLSGIAQAEYRCRATYENAQKVSEASVKESDALDALRSAIDSARGVTSLPTPVETAPESKWKSIETAPKDGTRILVTDGNYVSFSHWSETMRPPCFVHFNSATHWQPLPPPPQGKETRE